MLEVLRKQNNNNNILTKELIEESKPKDIIVTKYKEVTEYTEDGTKIIKRVPQNVNITKLVNETKKLVKTNAAEEKLAELEKIFSK